MENFTLIIFTIVAIAAILIVAVICIIRHFYNKRVTNKIEDLDIEKNTIASMPITPELAKIETFLKNDKIEELYNNWQERLKAIREKEIPTINDMLLDADYTLKQKDFKNVNLKLSTDGLYGYIYNLNDRNINYNIVKKIDEKKIKYIYSWRMEVEQE